MTYTIVIKEEAYLDLQQAYDYYEKQSPGLGERFLENVRQRIVYLQKYPLHFIKVEKDFRQALVDVFPYLIIYEISGHKVIVYAVFHGKQNPKKKFGPSIRTI